MAAALAESDQRPRRRPRVPGRGRIVQRRRSRPRPGWPGTGPASSTSARPSWTCPGTPTTTRSSTSGSPGPTARAATTTVTSSTASTTRPATSAGPSAATWSASSTWWPARTSRSRRSSRASFPMAGRGQGLRRPVLRRAEGGRRPALSTRRRTRRPCPGPPPAWSAPAPGRRRPRRRTDQAASGWPSASSARATTPRRCCCRIWPACRTPSSAHVATTRSLSAVNAQRRFGFTTASTSATAVLEDESLDAIFIVTRHQPTRDLVCRALETGKAVFVEKPLALTARSWTGSSTSIAKTGNDRLMVGFNRRFAPLLTQMKTEFGPAAPARSTRYLVNAGPLAADSWYRNEELEGSRFTGEGGHFIDTLSWWAGSLPEEVYAVRRPGEGRRPGHRAVRQRLQRRASATSPAATRATRRRRSTPPAAAGARGSTTSGRPRSGPGAARDDHEGPGRPGQGPARRAGRSSSRPSGPARPMPIPVESLVATTRATIAVRESLLSGTPGAGVSSVG